MGSLSIQKGKRAEREVANMLNPIIAGVCQREGVDVAKLQRNLKQVQQGGFDLDGLDWIAIEIKHHQQVAINSWWAQTVRQATQGRIPCLIWKKHGGKWQVRMRGQIPLLQGQSVAGVVDIADIDCFLVWFELMLIQQIRSVIPKGMDWYDHHDPAVQEPSASVSAVTDHVEIHAEKKPWE